MIFLCIFIIVVLSSNHRKVDAAHHPHQTLSDEYTYNHKDHERGPSAWGGECLTGNHQSPIDVRYKYYGVNWGYSKIWFANQYKQSQRGFFASNRGHTLQVQLNGDPKDPNSMLRISGAGLHAQYTFAQMHFHWGDRDEVGSEHTLQGQRFPMEIHLVHYKSRYGNLSAALAGKGKDPEAVMVFAVLCQFGKHENKALRPIVDVARLMSLQNPGGSQPKYRSQEFNILNILPKQLDFVRYFGSLTTPPCTPAVVWTVFLCPIQIEASQLEVFRKLHNTDGEEYYNYRPLQKLNGRKLKYCKVLENLGDDIGESPPTEIISQTIQNTQNEINVIFHHLLDLLVETDDGEKRADLKAYRNRTINEPRQFSKLDATKKLYRKSIIQS